jgi:glycine dehydrogenase subunit 1
MQNEKRSAFPYIPNSASEIKREMLKYTGADDIEEFFEDIPKKLRLTESLDLPQPYLSEADLKRHVGDLLKLNTSAEEVISFLGAGCCQHHVPAVCDEVNQRSEFLTAYAGEPYDDHGRFQALFEYASMMGDLLEMDVVNVPTYDGYQASATAIRMASRITGRKKVLVSRSINPGKLSKIRDYCKPDLLIELVDFDQSSGCLNMGQLRKRIDADTAALYIENPNYFGVIEPDSDHIAEIVHRCGSLLIASVDPISLGIFAPPVNYGADIACGDIQSLGMHMQCGGGQAGFIATADDPQFVMEFPSRLFGITPTKVPGEYGFGDVAYDRTSFAKREGGKEWVGTASALWGITAGVYLALMGPQGMIEIGESILTRVRYATRKIGRIKNVTVSFDASVYFKEFVVNFDETGKTAKEINNQLLSRGIQGGADLSLDFPELGESALYCITEIHSKENIDRLTKILREVTGS